MTEHNKHHDAPADGKSYWLDDKKNVGKIWHGMIVICVALTVADFFIDKHPYFSIEKILNFYGIFGFVSCVFLVLTAAQLRKVLMRDEDYYQRLEEERHPGDTSPAKVGDENSPAKAGEGDAQ
ncbi:MAG: hypothetical protein JKX88_08250 [Marinicaulis sp.]|nr:hypothetical protein [Marinicaulis sp.]